MDRSASSGNRLLAENVTPSPNTPARPRLSGFSSTTTSRANVRRMSTADNCQASKSFTQVTWILSLWLVLLCLVLAPFFPCLVFIHPPCRNLSEQSGKLRMRLFCLLADRQCFFAPCHVRLSPIRQNVAARPRLSAGRLACSGCCGA